MAARAPSAVVVAIRDPITRAELPGLCKRVSALLAATRPEIVFCDVRGARRDAVTIDALARLQLAARRHGCRVRLAFPSSELLELVAFMGLADVLPHSRGTSSRSGDSDGGGGGR